MNLRILIAAALSSSLLTACQPSDVKVKTVKERLDAGELVEFNEPGYRRPSCPKAAPDWKNISLRDNPERERFVLRAQSSALSPGKHSCYRVGGVVDLDVAGKSNGRARIRKLGIIKLEKLSAKLMRGKFFAKTDDFEKYKSDLANLKAMKADPEQLVTIVEVDYIDSSAVDQKTIEEKEREKNRGDGFEETAQDGQRVGECRNNSVWKELVVDQEFHAPIMANQLKSWYRLGNLNCLTQGQEVDVKSAIGADAPSSGVVKVRKVKIFKIEALKKERFDLPDFDFEKLKTKILSDNAKKNKPDQWIVVYDVQAPGGKSVQPVECRPDSITALEGTDVNAQRVTTVLPKGTCLKPGHLVMLIVPLGNNQSAEVPAKVVAVEERGEGIFVTVEKVIGGQP